MLHKKENGAFESLGAFCLDVVFVAQVSRSLFLEAGAWLELGCARVSSWWQWLRIWCRQRAEHPLAGCGVALW